MSRSHVTYTRKASWAVVALPNAMLRIDRALVYIAVAHSFIFILVECLILASATPRILVDRIPITWIHFYRHISSPIAGSNRLQYSSGLAPSATTTAYIAPLAPPSMPHTLPIPHAFRRLCQWR